MGGRVPRLRSIWKAGTLIALAGGLPLLPAREDLEKADQRALAGGATTVNLASSEAYGMPAPNLLGDRLEKHLTGDLDFEAKFVTAPAEINPGLGPHFNNVACINCHAKDGRGRPDKIGTALSSLFLRVSLPGETDTGGPVPVPGFGTQVADRAIYGVEPEAELEVAYEEFPVELAGGEIAHLRKPTYHLRNPHVPLPANILTSPRVAPPVFGRGLLEAIPQEAIVALADPEDRDGDGISGRPNFVWNPMTKQRELGRFGLKANTPNLLLQSAGAYLDDMGVVPPAETGAIYDRSGAPLEPEITWETLENVTFYVQTLGVPSRRELENPEVIRGEQIFHDIQCATCHTPEFQTGSLAGVPEVSGQTIQPFSDLLLHDLGQGLADGRPDYEATGSEWRTPPLWGIGLTKLVSGHSFFLHDGRARNLTEAILWHGGEAEASTEQFRKLPPEDRQALLRFLESL